MNVEINTSEQKQPAATGTGTMLAVKCKHYGGPDVIQIVEVPKPEPKPGEIRVRVKRTVVTPADCAARSGKPFLIRFFIGLTRPKKILGVEFAGVVDAIGSEVTGFKVGDEVFGSATSGFGAHAEYVIADAMGVVTAKPKDFDFGEAAGVCDGGLTALVFLRDYAHIKPGRRVLINGAAGSVGSFAVQLAKLKGAEVTAVCSPANFDFVQELGAGNVIDYNTVDFTQSGNAYDIVFDAVGKRTFNECKDVLTKGGYYLTTVPSWSIVFAMLKTKVFGGPKAIFAATGLEQKRENLLYLADLCEQKKLLSPVDRTYSLQDISEAHRFVDSGRKRGSAVVTVS